MQAKLLGNHKPGLLFVLSAPAGTGKTTLVQRLVQEFPCVKASISCTTRLPRKGEINGVHYWFVSKEVFDQRVKEDAFLEYVNLYGDCYGTPKNWVEEQLQAGKHVVLVIDTQGGLELRKKENAVFIFIRPPSLNVLKERLMNRKTESEEAIEQRLAWAEKEIREGQTYHYEIVNDDLEIAYQVLKSILIAEEHKLIKRENLSEGVVSGI